MKIERAVLSDVGEIARILADATMFQRECGFIQWRDGYPSEEDITGDIIPGNCWKVTDEGRILGVFSAIKGKEPSYEVLHDGSWLNPTDNYITIHRIGFDRGQRGNGLSQKAFAFASGLCRETGAASLRVDTHPDNAVMRKAIAHYGFIYCGVVYMADGTPRVAYEKMITEEEK